MKIHIAEQVDTVVWDLDGTLLESFDIFHGVLSTVMQQRGMEVPAREMFASHFHGPLEGSIRGVVGESVSSRDFDRILHDFLELDNNYIQHVDDHLHADAVDLAQRIHAEGGRRQIVVTDRMHGVNRGNGSPRTLIENSCLRDVIDAVVCRDEHGYRKPDTRCLDAHREGITEAVVVGDQMVDVEFAYALGFTALLVRRNDLPMARMDELGRFSSRTHVVSSLGQVGVRSPGYAIPQHRMPTVLPVPQPGFGSVC